MAVTVILLAAGYATRLYPLTTDRPKTLLPLGEGVILDAICAQIGLEVTARILVTNHRFIDQFRRWQAQRGGVPMTIVDDGTMTPETRLGAIQDLELARTQGRAVGDLVVVGTDNVFTWPLSDFLSVARRHAPAPSVALWEAPSTAAAVPFGVVTMDEACRITSFTEKSPDPPSKAVALCLYYFPEAMCSRIRDYVDDQRQTDAPGYFIQWLAGRGPVYGVPMNGLWYDIGTLATYEAVRRTWPQAMAAGRTGRPSA